MNIIYFIQTVNLPGKEVAAMYSSSTNTEYSPYRIVSSSFLCESSAGLRSKKCNIFSSYNIAFFYSSAETYVTDEEFLYTSVTQLC
jgi:hypothetical protein